MWEKILQTRFYAKKKNFYISSYFVSPELCCSCSFVIQVKIVSKC